MRRDVETLDDMLVALERTLSEDTRRDPPALKEILAEAGRIVEAAPAHEVARINREVGELLEKHGVLPENPGAAG
jgi:hypothetical protein